MSKSLLTAKLIGGGILGTGAVAAGGYGIVEHFRSKESTEQSENQTSQPNTNSQSGAQTDTQVTPVVTEQNDSAEPRSNGDNPGAESTGQKDANASDQVDQPLGGSASSPQSGNPKDAAHSQSSLQSGSPNPTDSQNGVSAGSAQQAS